MNRKHASRWDYDAAVIGGGPAGATCAAALARRGRRVLVLERERFPRFHIGESLISHTNEVFDAIGLPQEALEASFVEKWGAQFLAPDGGADRYVDFAAAAETPTPRTFQVLRSRFDEILLDHAAACGAEVRQESRALGASFDPDGVSLSFAGPDGAARQVRAGAVVDASGRAGFLAARLGLRRPDPDLRKVAIHAHFTGIPRPEGRRTGDIRIILRPDLGWVWFIPLPGGDTSVGVVVDHRVHAARPKASAEEMLAAYLAETPRSAALCRDAARTSPARCEADFSYAARRYAGDRFLLTGDAAAFLDPIFSTGVLLALRSGLDAAEALDAGIGAADLSARRFRAYERRVRRRTRHFRRFVVGFYDAAFRDIFFQPSARFGLSPAVASALAGNCRPSLRTRLKLGAFLALTRLQRHVTLVPRLAASPAPSGDEAPRPAALEGLDAPAVPFVPRAGDPS